MRNTFHSYADELAMLSDTFRRAKQDGRVQNNLRVLNESSIRAIEILRNLALAARAEAEYDADLRSRMGGRVGKVAEDAAPQIIEAALRDYEGPYSVYAANRVEYRNLTLRGSLDKIAHANPNPGRSNYFVYADTHEMILTGIRKERGEEHPWVSILSIGEFIHQVRKLPDRAVSSEYAIQ